ncbi:AI-2E family transporter [Arthrobacter glacialis]|uniref:AI-2E family transporter n=1 Tax=Arthrobacter glacialis TaxID=1664 RepID=A0A2S3ZQU7_ARTGL|nr:AI-2E family transporter [Arthrobacter glacialis]POH58383.1 AI-2E family transporter [Arthrobacter glacialis]POH71601.1 AI-2E family transporter [Arthrobacter glacialis]
MSESRGIETPVAEKDSSGTKVLISLAAAVIVLFGLSRISSIVGPVFLAIVLTICVYPLKQRLVLRGVPAAVATVSTILAVYAMIGALVASLWVSAVQLTQLLPQFAPQITELRGDLMVFLHDTLGIGNDQVRALVESVDLRVLLDTAYSLLGSVMNVGSGTVFLLLLVMFMSIDATYFPTILAVVKEKRAPVVEALGNFAKLSRSFMVMTTIFGAIVAVLNLILLLALGVPGAGLWALLAFVCGFIPFIGFWISLVPAAIMALLAGGLPSFIAVVAFYGVINSLIQSIIQPKFVSGSVNLNMTLTFLSVIFWSALLGPLGALMAVPLSLFARAILIDSHPQSAWLRPFIGDVTESKAMLAAQRAAAKTAKVAKGEKARKSGQESPGV